MSIAALRQRLAVIVDPPRTGGAAAVPTGIAALDQALSDGGLPCGRLAEVVGGRGSGKTTLVRQIVASAVAAGRWVAYVDGARMLVPRDWASLGGTRRLWVVRPPNAERSAWCADVLLRSGAFGLVVLDGGPPLSRSIAIRLTRLARDRDAALVVVGDERGGALVGSAVRLRVHRRRATDDRRVQSPAPAYAGARVRREATLQAQGSLGARHSVLSAKSLGIGHSERSVRTLCITVEKGGAHHSVEVGCAIEVARRLCAHPEVPDRRGVASRNRRGERAVPGTPGRREPAEARAAGRKREAGGRRATKSEGSEPGHPPRSGLEPPASGLALPRKRRCAEPIVRRDAFLLAGEDRR